MYIKIIILILLIAIIGFLLYSLHFYKETFENNIQKYYFVHISKNGGTSMKDIIKNNDLNIEYIGHDYPKINDNEIVILRDPIDRFISAFYYGKQNYTDNYKYFKNPNELIESVVDKLSEKHKYTDFFFNNSKTHTINGIKTTLWTYTPQIKWFNNPKFVLRFTHLEEDFNKCLNDIEYKNTISIPKKNKSTHRDTYLSDKSITFLKNYYKKDFELLETNPFTYG